MSAKQGNQTWRLRCKHGRNKKYESPEALWDACAEYFDWVEDNPLQVEKVFHHGAKILRYKVGRLRPMTLTGLCVYLGICENTWSNYREDYNLSETVEQAESIVYVQKYEGVAANLFNASIIVKDLSMPSKINWPDKRSKVESQM